MRLIILAIFTTMLMVGSLPQSRSSEFLLFNSNNQIGNPAKDIIRSHLFKILCVEDIINLSRINRFSYTILQEVLATQPNHITTISIKSERARKTAGKAIDSLAKPVVTVEELSFWEKKFINYFYLDLNFLADQKMKEILSDKSIPQEEKNILLKELARVVYFIVVAFTNSYSTAKLIGVDNLAFNLSFSATRNYTVNCDIYCNPTIKAGKRFAKKSAYRSASKMMKVGNGYSNLKEFIKSNAARAQDEKNLEIDIEEDSLGEIENTLEFQQLMHWFIVIDNDNEFLESHGAQEKAYSNFSVNTKLKSLVKWGEDLDTELLGKLSYQVGAITTLSVLAQHSYEFVSKFYDSLSSILKNTQTPHLAFLNNNTLFEEYFSGICAKLTNKNGEHFIRPGLDIVSKILSPNIIKDCD